MNLLVFSSDPIALDATVCRIIDVNPEHVPTITMGHRSGSGSYLEKEIEWVGDDFDSFRLPDFDIERSPLAPYRDRGIMRFLSNRFVPRPVIVAEKCVACGVCVTMCPTAPKSVDWFEGDKKKPPMHNYKTCIRCYCCQEICPESAIELQYPLIRRVFGRGRAHG
jgi:Pyruvate/2-oxoacid:ferredoxin oxidoreductase delta subunit